MKSKNEIMYSNLRLVLHYKKYMQCFQVLNSFLTVFSKITHCNYCFRLNTFYYFYPPPPKKKYDQEKFPSSSCYWNSPLMFLNPSTLLGTGEYITWVLSRYNCGRLNITMPKKEYRILALQDNNTNRIAANFCEK